MLRTMLRGQTGPDVLAIQEALNIRTSNRGLITDGKFGPKTEAAVKDFQKRSRLKTHGIVGPRTRSVLYPLVATTLNLVGTKNAGGGGLIKVANSSPKFGTLGLGFRECHGLCRGRV
jgi:peptidoglycan hydrolase-like protein with peptidoglycan-binding domain